MAKKKNSRKVLAVALGIMGIAGLSLASASQLTINTNSNISTGTQTFGDPCANTVGVAYTLAGTSLAPTFTDVKISGIPAACVAVPVKAISYLLTYQTWNSVASAYDAAATVTATDVQITALNSGTNSLTVPLPAAAQAGTTKFVSIAITIK